MLEEILRLCVGRFIAVFSSVDPVACGGNLGIGFSTSPCVAEAKVPLDNIVGPGMACEMV
jgi:hypothetical protein